MLPMKIQVSEMMLKKYLSEAQQHTFITLVQVRCVTCMIYCIESVAFCAVKPTSAKLC